MTRSSCPKLQPPPLRPGQQITAVLRPKDREQLQQLVRIANQFCIPLYPVSRGRNWGLGSRVPVQDGNAVVDLSGMNRILDYDERLSYITVEPGVTFTDAANYLAEQNSKSMLSVTGGPADASLLANIVERGDGAGPYGDRMSYIGGMEIVLPTGEIIHTGLGKFSPPNAATHRWGLGPAVDGLFTQSNLGIVSSVTVWLRRRPACVRVLSCQIDDPQNVPPLMDTVRELQLEGTIATHCFGLWNRHKVAALASQNKSNANVLDVDKFPEDCWLGTAVVYAADAHVGDLQLNRILTAVKPFITNLSIQNETNCNPAYLGQPTDENAKSVYWRKPNRVGSDIEPERDRCGVIWLCHTMPLVGYAIGEILKLIETTAADHGFEPNVGLACVHGRCVHIYVAILFDREVEGEDQRAMDYHDQLFDVLIGNGCWPYRLGIQSMQRMPAFTDQSSELLARLKRALDPSDVLAPGRYDFREHWNSPPGDSA